MLSNLILAAVVLLALEVPLAVVYSRHEHDSLSAAVQRDGGSLAALSEEIIEHPADHNVGAVARRFSQGEGGGVLIESRSGTVIARSGLDSLAPVLQRALGAALGGQAIDGEGQGLTYTAVPVGTREVRGAVLVARSDATVLNRVHQFWALLAIIGGVVLGGSIIVSDRLARWAIDPLRQLDESATMLGRGDLSARAQTKEGPPEIIALAASFNEMADRLDELVRSQRRFVADASHQLRSPLTALRLRLENLSVHEPAQVTASRDAALQETARLTRLVDGLLALVRAEVHRPQRQTVDVVDALERRADAWSSLAMELGVRLQVLPAPDTNMTATMPPDHLEQILDNLIDNALDATETGGVVALSVGRKGSMLEIHVTDEGRGMTDEERLHAFDPFWQSPDNHSVGNTGLGLAIVQQLVRSSRGSVSLDPNPGGGVNATICLPACDA